MSRKKSKFSYIVWFIYTMVTVVVLRTSIENVAKSLLGEIAFADLILSLAIVVITGLTVFLMYRFSKWKKLKSKEKNNSRVVWEVGTAVWLLILGLILRLDVMMSEQGELAAYYENARVAEGQMIPSVVHGASYFYLQLLHVVFLFIGNKFSAAVWLQIILQLIAALMIFVGIRKLSEPVTALVSLGFFMLADPMIKGAVTLSPQMLYLLIFALGLGFLAACQSGKLRPVVFLGTGIWIGVSVYLDVGGLLLLILLAACATGNRVKNAKTKDKLMVFGFGVIGALAGFLGAIGANAFFSGRYFGNVMNAWMELYRPGTFQLPTVLVSENTSWWIIVLAVFLTAGIFSFWCDRESERMSAWVLCACVTFAAGCADIFTDELPAFLYLFLITTVLAGLGVGEVFYKPIAVELPTVLEKNARKEREEEQKQVQVAISNTAPETPVELETAVAVVKESEPAETVTEKPAVEETKKINYIENPLPLPKPHVKKTMGYDRKPNAGEDDFDHPVSDNDDFDI